jgi:hypothetical protein
MASYRVFGEHLISETEFARKGYEITQLAAAGAGSKLPSVTLENEHVLTPANILPAGAPAVIEFPAVEYGKPMTIDIRSVYTGNVGSKDFLSGTGDVAVASGVKDWGAFKASARALNWVNSKKGKSTILPGPNAITDGTRIVAYQKAVATSQLIATFEIAAAAPEKGVLDKIGGAFSAAAGIPLFMPYAGALLAAGQILPLAGKLIGALSGNRAPWSQTEELTFAVPGYPLVEADFRIVAPATSGLHTLKYKAGVGLIDSAGNLYKGEEPYMVIAIYGGEREELEGFTPAVMAADMAKRFYPSSSGIGAAIDDIMEIAQVASDWRYREQAVKLRAKLEELPAGDTEGRKNLQKKLDAIIANISQKAFKP